MTAFGIALVFLAVAGLVLLVYWQVIVAEGTYLGSRVVAWTYDVVASRYDAIKQFNPRDESWFVAGPLLRALGPVERPLVLDVATGTGRLPQALLREHFGAGAGRVVGLDLSRGMLRQASRNLRAWGDQVTLIRQDADRLPFLDATFDAVTCLESLEFMPRPRQVLAEMVRVLAPGGVLLVTNRVGRQARLLPRRALPRPVFEQLLAGHHLREVQVRPWQVSYDLAVARKEGPRDVRDKAESNALALVRCPTCAGRLERGIACLSCPACRRAYSLRDGIVTLVDSVERIGP